MTMFIDALFVFLILTNLVLLGSSRITACIRTVAVQGFLLGSLPLILSQSSLSLHLLLVAGGGMVVKGVAFPLLLSRALREADVRREVEPFIGFTSSILMGIFALMFSFWFASRLPIPAPIATSLAVPVAFFTILAGLFLIISRRLALNQVLGYLVLENGIYVFGVMLVKQSPFLVELGILLDVLVAVFVMGITIFHISREFDHIDTEQLAVLKDWEDYPHR